jgi:hypothetical protein
MTVLKLHCERPVPAGVLAGVVRGLSEYYQLESTDKVEVYGPDHEKLTMLAPRRQ